MAAFAGVFKRLVQVRRGRWVPDHIRASGIQEGHGSIESCTVTCVATDVRAAKSVVAHYCHLGNPKALVL